MDTGAQSGIVGDMQKISELPHTKVEEAVLVNEKKMARFSKTKEFQRLKEYCEQRIDFYQHFLPGGGEVGLKETPTSEDWMVANRVIGELRGILQAYEQAEEVVKNDTR